MTVTIRELKNRLSEYLRRVRAGEQLIVTDHGLPVAVVAPVELDGLGVDERLAMMAAAGELTQPQRAGGLKVTKPTRVRGRALSTTILEDRR